MDLKHRSRGITDGRDRAPARAMFKAIGFSDDDLRKPLIGVANTWIETMPCNFHLRRLSAKVKDGIRAAGGTPMEFNTIAISDGETMGTEGMKASLVSREVIADSIESAITSRLIRDVFIPSVPIVMPSLMAMVLNSIGVPPAARIPSFTLAESRRR